jgi:hypothetical protein
MGVRDKRYPEGVELRGRWQRRSKPKQTRSLPDLRTSNDHWVLKAIISRLLYLAGATFVVYHIPELILSAAVFSVYAFITIWFGFIEGG